MSRKRSKIATSNHKTGAPVSPVVRFHTFGCKANQYDTEQMRRELESRGARTAGDWHEAGVAVVNTCTVTAQADADARHLIRRLRREHPDMTILVAGCSTALRGEQYQAMPEVDAVVGGQNPFEVAEALALVGALPDVLSSAALPAGADLPARGSALSRRGTRAWLKVQDGCDRKCSFCATRLARGTSRSRDPDEIVAEARELALEHPELVITGIHIGHYGCDLQEPSTLGRLCARLLEEVDARIRLSSIEATEIDDLVLELLKTSGGKLAPHLHVPLQSGSDRTLRRMRRWHTRDAYRSRVLQIAEAMPALGLGADVIVGFPGEGDEEYADTRDLITELPYTYLHVFPFSARDDTAAAELPGRIPGNVSAARSRQLREIALVKGRLYRARRVGTLADVVLEGDELVTSGLTGDYLRVEARGAGWLPGQRVQARLESDGRDNLYIEPEPLSGVQRSRAGQ